MKQETWIPRKLNELGFVRRGKSKHRPRNEPSLYGGQYPFFQTGEIKETELYLREYSQTYNEKGLAQSKLWKPGTLCITIAANIAETAILGIEACFPDSIVGFIADEEKSDVRFVKYYIDTLKLRMQSISRGTTQDNLSVDKLLSFDIFTPPLPIQRKIADVLSAYDDLIEVNARRIRVLETMAQSVYREWFGAETLRATSVRAKSLPSGWEMVKVGELINFAKGKKPKTTSPTGKTPLLLIESLRSGATEFLDDPTSVIAKTDDIIMVMDGASSGSIYTGVYGAVGSTLGRYRPIDRQRFSHYQFYFFILENFKQIADNNIGSAIPHANKDFINQLDIAIPPQKLENQFHEQMVPMFELISVLKKKNANLRRTRDLLLPRLVSGEVEV